MSPISFSGRFQIKHLASALALVCVLSPTLASAEDGAALYVSKACVTCHGPMGREPLNDDMPVIAGQNKNYLVMQIKNIRSGDRDSGNAIQMKGIAQTLSDEDIDAISDFLSSQEVTYVD
jgi:cytochrome c